jgi:phage shock protein PspC (stress-responsive transcriptional regulator)
MQRIIQINIAGRVLPIEEDAYLILKDYLSSLERQFTGAEGKEILEDIENRIAELFGIRLAGGAPAIDRFDVRKVIETLGSPADLGGGETNSSQSHNQYSQNTGYQNNQGRNNYRNDRLLRDPYDKVIGGVCSGMAHYFGIDPVIIRLVLVVLFLTAGIGVLIYIIAWAVIPVANSREELYNMTSSGPVTFYDITRNVEKELQDLKKRGEQMSRELKEFFGNKK